MLSPDWLKAGTAVSSVQELSPDWLKAGTAVSRVQELAEVLKEARIKLKHPNKFVIKLEVTVNIF